MRWLQNSSGICTHLLTQRSASALDETNSPTLQNPGFKSYVCVCAGRVTCKSAPGLNRWQGVQLCPLDSHLSSHLSRWQNSTDLKRFDNNHLNKSLKHVKFRNKRRRTTEGRTHVPSASEDCITNILHVPMIMHYSAHSKAPVEKRKEPTSKFLSLCGYCLY